jgi:hypothetical protein
MNDRFEAASLGMQEAWVAAQKANPGKVHESFYLLAGRPVRMRVVGDRLAEHLHRPFVHLAINNPTAPPDLTVDFWDESETGISCPMGSLLQDDWTDDPVSVARSNDRRIFATRLRQSMTVFDRKIRQIFGCSFQPQRFSLYERGRPLHVPLSVWHFDYDAPIIHAALVSKADKGVLFAGNSGAGKTTSALSCLAAGFKYLSEDQVALEHSVDGVFTGHSLYNSTYVEEGHLTHFPSLAAHTIAGVYPDEEKFLIFLASLFDSRMESNTRISAVVLPRIVKCSGSRIRPASKAEALLTLAPSSLIVGMLSSGLSGFKKLARLVEHVPSYALELGPNVNDIPVRVDEILSRA